ncbi:alpha/beta-hydrolase [Penicillium pulvis]|uniref:alpha/beta-hydrolase n=1 Tax=Penicillium pulvis TaxID=1562058 RepID=UPI0025487C96|nr:alpha/beta-hydrolase [Penicillium pulvis]KAJ5805879.1 alpha/beta-hydrolase [Penicillium pulvis]
MKSRRLIPETVTLNDGSKAHWIGSSKSDIIILFFHGGGYVFPALNGHFVLLKCLLDNIHQKTHKSVATLVLQYGKYPDNPHSTELSDCISTRSGTTSTIPRPLNQAVALLEYVTSDLAIDPSRIVLAGESAEGSIALGLALHLNRPHPSLPKLELKSPIMGLALISPWVSTKASSWTRNRKKDVLSVEMCKIWSEAYMGTSTSSSFSEPLTAPGGWWKDLSIPKILLTDGSNEVFIGEIEQMGAILDDEFLGKVTTIIIEGMSHGESIFSKMLGNEGPTREADAFVEWICKMTET